MSDHVIEHVQDSQNPPTSTTAPGTIVFNTLRASGIRGTKSGSLLLDATRTTTTPPACCKFC
jgi:agmatinase